MMNDWGRPLGSQRGALEKEWERVLYVPRSGRIVAGHLVRISNHSATRYARPVIPFANGGFQVRAVRGWGNQERHRMLALNGS